MLQETGCLVSARAACAWRLWVIGDLWVIAACRVMTDVHAPSLCNWSVSRVGSRSARPLDIPLHVHDGAATWHAANWCHVLRSSMTTVSCRHVGVMSVGQACVMGVLVYMKSWHNASNGIGASADVRAASALSCARLSPCVTRRLARRGQKICGRFSPD
eukprot:2026603-Alexandrium_andersonii.AAC.1